MTKTYYILVAFWIETCPKGYPIRRVLASQPFTSLDQKPGILVWIDHHLPDSYEATTASVTLLTYTSPPD